MFPSMYYLADRLSSSPSSCVPPEDTPDLFPFEPAKGHTLSPLSKQDLLLDQTLSPCSPQFSDGFLQTPVISSPTDFTSSKCVGEHCGSIPSDSSEEDAFEEHEMQILHHVIAKGKSPFYLFHRSHEHYV